MPLAWPKSWLKHFHICFWLYMIKSKIWFLDVGTYSNCSHWHKYVSCGAWTTSTSNSLLLLENNEADAEITRCEYKDESWWQQSVFNGGQFLQRSLSARWRIYENPFSFLRGFHVSQSASRPVLTAATVRLSSTNNHNLEECVCNIWGVCVRLVFPVAGPELGGR